MRYRCALSIALTALVVCVGLSGPAAAQSAAIRGRIVDEQGRAVPGATVTLADPRTGFKRIDESEGLYRFAGLSPGTYNIGASRDGFTLVEQEATIVEVAAIVHLDFRLAVAAVVATVNIVAPSPLIQTASPTWLTRTANILFAASDAQGLAVVTGQFLATNPDGLRNPDGSFFAVGDPISNIAALNEGGQTGLFGEVVSPRLREPYARQASFGWSHRIGTATTFSADVIHSDGRDLNVRARLNSRPGGGPRRFGDLALDPNTANFRVVISPLRSNYNALLLSLRRRSATGLDFALSYTLAKARSELGQGVDETGLGPNTIQDATDPFAPVEYGPAASDARHLVSLSAIVPVVWQIQVAPLFHHRSALPVFITDGVDRNNDFNANDIPERAVAFCGVGRPARDVGPCRTINCGRGAASTTFDLRVSRRFNFRGSHLTAIAEIFNLFDASNPSAFNVNARRLLGTVQSASPNPDFLQPASFSGDFQQPVQRVGQLALRWSF
jgi:hypothetical protein